MFFCLKWFFCKKTKGLLPALILPFHGPFHGLWDSLSPDLCSARGHEVRKRSQLDKCSPVFLTLSCLAPCKPLPLILSLNISLSFYTISKPAPHLLSSPLPPDRSWHAGAAWRGQGGEWGALALLLTLITLTLPHRGQRRKPCWGYKQQILP